MWVRKGGIEARMGRIHMCPSFPPPQKKTLRALQHQNYRVAAPAAAAPAAAATAAAVVVVDALRHPWEIFPLSPFSTLLLLFRCACYYVRSAASSSSSPPPPPPPLPPPLLPSSPPLPFYRHTPKSAIIVLLVPSLLSLFSSYQHSVIW